MPDLLDQIHAEATGPRSMKPGEDLNPAPLPTGTPMPPMSPERVQSLGAQQQQTTNAHAPGGWEGLANASGAQAFGSFLNRGSRLMETMQVNRPLGLAPMPPEKGEDILDRIHAEAQAGVSPDERQLSQGRATAQIARNNAMISQVAPYNPDSIAGKVGGVIGNVAPILAAGPLAPAEILARGAEGREETIDSNPTLSEGQKLAYRTGGAGLDLAMGGLLPGAGKAAAGLVPAMSPLANGVARAVSSAAGSGAEMAAFNMGQNLLASATGADPNRTLMQGTTEAALTGGIIGGVSEGMSPPPTALASPAAPENPVTESSKPESVAATPDAKRIAALEKRLAAVDYSKLPDRPTESVQAQPKELESEKPEKFITSKGSTYDVQGNTTTRFKTEDGTSHPASSSTVYLDQATVDQYVGKTGAFRNTERGPVFTDGQTETPVPHSTTPEVGKSPLELWDDGQFHLGHDITEVQGTPAGHTFQSPEEAGAQPMPDLDRKLAESKFIPRRAEENPVPPDAEGERRFEELAKGATFETPEEAAKPSVFEQAAGNQAVREEFGEPASTDREKPIGGFDAFLGSEHGGAARAAAGGAFLEQDVLPAAKRFADRVKAVGKALDRSENLGFTTSDQAKQTQNDIRAAWAEADEQGHVAEARLSRYLEVMPGLKENRVESLRQADAVERGENPLIGTPHEALGQQYINDLQAMRQTNAAVGKKLGLTPMEIDGLGSSRRFEIPGDPASTGRGSLAGAEQYRLHQQYPSYSAGLMAAEARGGGSATGHHVKDQILAQYQLAQSIKMRLALRAAEDEGSTSWRPDQNPAWRGGPPIGTPEVRTLGQLEDKSEPTETSKISGQLANQAGEIVPQENPETPLAAEQQGGGLAKGQDTGEVNPHDTRIDDKIGRETRRWAAPADKSKEGVWVRPGESTPKGYRLTDIEHTGSYYAPEDVAEAWNSRVPKDTNAISEAVRDSLMATVGLRYNLSPAHAVNGFLKFASKNIYDATSKLWGGTEASLREIVGSLNLFGPRTNLILKEWADPGSTNPEIGEIVRRMRKGGWGLHTKSVLDPSLWQPVVDSFKSGNWQGGTIKAIGAAGELFKRGTYDVMLNRMAVNLGNRTALDQMRRGTGEAEGQADMVQAAEAFNRAVGRHVDSPNFRNSIVDATGKLMAPAFTFRAGLLRNVGETLRGNPHAASFVVGQLIQTAITGTALTYLATGDRPKTLRDLFNPINPWGDTNKAGHHERITLGDNAFLPRILGAEGTEGMANEAQAVANPLITGGIETARNKDFYGNQVRPTEGSTAGNIARGAWHTLKGGVPLAVESQLPANPEGGDSFTAAGRVARYAGVGFSHPVTSEAEKFLYDRLGDKGMLGGRDLAAQSKHANTTRWVDMIRAGQKDQALREMAKDPTMTREGRLHVLDRAKDQANLARLMGDSRIGPEDILEAWHRGSDEDKAQMKDAIMRRARGSKSSSVADMIAWRKVREAVQ